MEDFLGLEKTDSQKVEEYTEFLVGLGYIVIPPKKLDPTSIRGGGDLVDYFYSLLQYNNRDRKIHHFSASKRDLTSAKNLIKSRTTALGGSRKRALQEAAAIVKCLIENEELFGFKDPISSMDCLGQDNMKWVTDKAISIINKEDKDAEERDMKEYEIALYHKQEQEALKNIEENDDEVERLKKILGGLEDGEEERK